MDKEKQYDVHQSVIALSFITANPGCSLEDIKKAMPHLKITDITGILYMYQRGKIVTVTVDFMDIRATKFGYDLLSAVGDIQGGFPQPKE